MIALVLASVALSPALAGGASRGAEMIQTFMRDKGIQAEAGTGQYVQFMKAIMLGQYPELTRSGSTYASNQKDLDAVLQYATEQISPPLCQRR